MHNISYCSEIRSLKLNARKILYMSYLYSYDNGQGTFNNFLKWTASRVLNLIGEKRSQIYRAASNVPAVSSTDIVQINSQFFIRIVTVYVGKKIEMLKDFL